SAYASSSTSPARSKKRHSRSHGHTRASFTSSTSAPPCWPRSTPRPAPRSHYAHPPAYLRSCAISCPLSGNRAAELRCGLVCADVVAGALRTVVVVDVDGHRGRRVRSIDRRAAVGDAVIATFIRFGDVRFVELRLARNVADTRRGARLEQRVIDRAAARGVGV